MFLGCNSNIDLPSSVENGGSGMEVDMCRRSNTPPIESLLTSTSLLHEDRMILNAPSNNTNPIYSKPRQANKNCYNNTLLEMNNHAFGGIKRRKLSTSPVAYSQYRAKRYINYFPLNTYKHKRYNFSAITEIIFCSEILKCLE